MGKRRFRGPGGALFVPNVDDETIAVMVEAGEWTPVEGESSPASPVSSPKPKPKPAPAGRSGRRSGSRGSSAAIGDDG